MNENKRVTTTRENETKPQTTAAATAQDVREYFKFADRELGVDWGVDGAPEEYTPEFIASHPDFTQIFMVRDSNNAIIAGAKVKKITPDVQSRLGLDKGDLAKQIGVLLEYTVVREDKRNSGILSLLTQKRLDWSKEHGAEYACAEVEITRPISAYTKIRDGFVFVGIQEPGAGIPDPYLVAVKPIIKDASTNESTKKKHDQFEWKEIEINENSEKDLAKLFMDGWVGVDIKSNSETCPWTLILEKKK